MSLRREYLVMNGFRPRDVDIEESQQALGRQNTDVRMNSMWMFLFYPCYCWWAIVLSISLLVIVIIFM